MHTFQDMELNLCYPFLTIPASILHVVNCLVYKTWLFLHNCVPFVGSLAACQLYWTSSIPLIASFTDSLVVCYVVTRLMWCDWILIKYVPVVWFNVLSVKLNMHSLQAPWMLLYGWDPLLCRSYDLKSEQGVWMRLWLNLLSNDLML